MLGATPHFWPEWTYHVSWLWTNPASYNFSSSEWGGLVFKVLELLVIFVVVRCVVQPWAKRVHAHMECHVDGCERWGHPVHPTGYRACAEHHPVIKSDGPITAQDIADAHAGLAEGVKRLSR